MEGDFTLITLENSSLRAPPRPTLPYATPILLSGLLSTFVVLSNSCFLLIILIFLSPT